MRISYDDGRERLRERIPAPGAGEALAYAVSATMLGFIGGFAVWAHTGHVAALPGTAAAAGGLTLLLKGLSHHRIVATTYRYDASPAAAPAPAATPVKVTYWERTEHGHVRRERESSVAREQWARLADAIAEHGAGSLSRRRAGISGPTWAQMAAELRALGMIAADEHIRHIGPDGLRYIRTVAGVAHSPTAQSAESTRARRVNPTQTHPNPATQAARGGAGAGEPHIVAMEPAAADDGLLWVAVHAAAAIIGAGGAWRLCLAAEAAGWLAWLS